MPKPVPVLIVVLVLAAVIVAVDLLFFKNLFWERLAVNVGIILVVAGAQTVQPLRANTTVNPA